MSTQSIHKVDYQSISDSVDAAMICVADSILMSSSFGTKPKFNPLNEFRLVYIKKMMNERFCKSSFREGDIQRISRLINSIV